MDALKKAEQAKRQGEPVDNKGQPPSELQTPPDRAESPSPAPVDVMETDPREAALAAPAIEIELEPVAPSRSPSARREPSLSTGPESRPADGHKASSPAVAAPVRGGQKASSDAGQSRKEVDNLFAVKERPPQPAVRKNFAVVAGLLTVIAASAIGGYVWWQIQPRSGLASNLGLATNTGARPIAPTPVQSPASAPVATAMPTPPPVAEPMGKEKQAAPAALSSSAKGTPARSGSDEDEEPAIPPQRRQPPASTMAPRDAGDTIRVTRAPQKVNPSLMRAYEAFGRGETALAQVEYEAILKTDPHNTDALHGMAAIALRDGRQDAAAHYFQRILVANPKDAVAVAALINMQGQADPAAAESRLKLIAAEQPDNPAPQFALGNLHAAKERWGDAQQAYFKAYNLDSTNPDTLFNLAVSLEHLRQDRLAAQYYAQSLEAAKRRPFGFDLGLAQARLRALQP